MAVEWELNYDRRVSSEFLELFLREPCGLLVDIAHAAPYPVDLQLRHDPKANKDHVSLYAGLTDVLKVERKPKSDGLRLSAHKTWSENPQFGFDVAWRDEVKTEDWNRIEDYLERVLPEATAKHAGAEGAVQAAVSKFTHSGMVMIDREAALHFRDQPTKDHVFAEITQPMVAAIQGLSGVKGQVPKRFGGECDLLAVDHKANRLYAIEIKPRNVGTIRWAAAQATVYARLFERWFRPVPSRPDPLEVLRGEWSQRTRLKLAPRVPDTALTTTPAVVPVVVVQRGTRPALVDEFRRVQERLCERGVGVPELELYEAGIAGRLHELAL